MTLPIYDPGALLTLSLRLADRVNHQDSPPHEALLSIHIVHSTYKCVVYCQIRLTTTGMYCADIGYMDGQPAAADKIC